MAKALYRYKLPVKFDPYLLDLALSKEFGDIYLRWTETETEMIVQFTRELTPEEKAKLDGYIESPPMPKVKLIFEPDLASEIEALIGKRPVLVDYDPAVGRCVLWFDVDITSVEEEAIEGLLRAKHLGKLRRE